MNTQVRIPAQITYTSWKALFLRAAVNSLSASRSAWFWLIAEPVSNIVILMVVFSVIRVRTIGGISTAIWIMAGFLAFFMFRRTATQAMNAIRPSRKLFVFTQIRPADTVIVRAALEGFLMVIITIVLILGAWFYGLAVVPADPIAVLEAMFGLWLFGLGFGLMNSVALAMVEPIGKMFGFLLGRLLYFVSGVLIPLSVIPYPYKDWLLLNPVAHGLEAMRLGFAPYYHVDAQISTAYLYAWALVSIFLGLALQVRYSKSLSETRGD